MGIGRKTSIMAGELSIIKMEANMMVILRTIKEMVLGVWSILRI